MIKTKFGISIFIVIFLLLHFSLKAQETSGRQFQIGLKLNYSIISEQMPEKLFYRPVLVLGFYQFDFNSKHEHSFFSFYFEPQINPVMINYKFQELEFGLNFGIQYSYKINELNILYGAIGTGPHFITVNTRMQAKGFIFSDNFTLGYKRGLENDYYLDFDTRFRHISNAGLKTPNYGIDNFFIGNGLLKAVK